MLKVQYNSLTLDVYGLFCIILNSLLFNIISLFNERQQC